MISHLVELFRLDKSEMPFLLVHSSINSQNKMLFFYSGVGSLIRMKKKSKIDSNPKKLDFATMGKKMVMKKSK